MRMWLLRRLAAAVATVLLVLTLTFAAIHLAPGTPFIPRGDRAPLDSATVARLRSRFGLDQPVTTQYAHYLSALARGELGQSFSERRPVRDMLADAIPNTLLLTASALLIDLVLGMLIGVYQATHARQRSDIALTNVTLMLYSIPTFWLGLILLLVFGQWLHWLPVGGIRDAAMYDIFTPWQQLTDRLRHLVLPAITLGMVGAAGTARYQRPAIIEALQQEHLRVARAKGIGSRGAIWQHAVRNALLPYITLVGLALPFLLTGAVVVETVFAWPGMGKLAADAIATRDYPVVAASTLLAAVMVVTGSLIADLLYAAADPRVRQA